MGKKRLPVLSANPNEWIASDLESMSIDLQTILDHLERDLDSLTVGEVKRIKVLANAVAEGAKAVILQTIIVNPSLTAGGFHPSSISPKYATAEPRGSDRGCA